ncbi:hypothetical protein DPMN_000372 [Dreissena polymorpha]|uniref:Uncharacterized protein n=1 Tax=Dreissena polymorpha TaxID=45954 RepID=A0A9D4RS09_DREPO|nr:hypothetical protein DPMN_000372 [Dreissena polymorpha]
MMNKLGWTILESRRQTSKVLMMYRIVNNLISGHQRQKCTYSSRSAHQRPCTPLNSVIYHRQRLPVFLFPNWKTPLEWSPRTGGHFTVHRCLQD